MIPKSRHFALRSRRRMRPLVLVSDRATDMKTLRERLEAQRFANGYELVNGVAMRSANPAHFQIPPDVIKRQVKPGQFVELRIDSPRFSVHEATAEKCLCPTCEGVLSKPILRHSHPASLSPLPAQVVASRGWGEDFWVRILERYENLFCGLVDNPLVEARLHGLNLGDEIVLHEDHILAVHEIHRWDLVSGMNEPDLTELAKWLAEGRGSRD